jgi:hypothetical protein
VNEISAEYGSEQEYGEEEPNSANESDMDRMMQGLEEDELVKDELKMPSDLEGDEEESEDEGLFGHGGVIDEEVEESV